jgi:type VI protein secretion system component VasK
MNQFIFQQFLGGFWQSLTQPIQDWLLDHPFGNWLLSHPLWAIGLVLIALLLLSGLFGAIAQLTQTLWIVLLRSPVVLIGWLVAGIILLVKAPFRSPGKLPAAETKQQRLAEILDRLDALKQEQDNLLQEAKQILSTKEFG